MLARATDQTTKVPRVIWAPDEATIEHANATRLVRRAGCASYAELVRRSQEEPDWFWPLCVEDLGIDSPSRGRGCTTTRAAPSGRRGSSAAR